MHSYAQTSSGLTRLSTSCLVGFGFPSNQYLEKINCSFRPKLVSNPNTKHATFP
eukprot:m.324235 g.324235  ORF g.324235 m.324235 type:complete len:54 (+) comp19729_c0_seq20:2510-2671(+)